MKTEDCGTVRSNRIGLSAIVVNWIAAAISVPFAKMINGRFTAEELLIWRSLGCILVALTAINFRRAQVVPLQVKVAGFVIGFSSICFYEVLHAWNVGATMVMLCFIPVGSMLLALRNGHRIHTSEIISLCCVVIGTAWALEFWNQHQHLSLLGLFWMLLCILVSTVGFDMWGKSPTSVTVSEKSFWLAVGCGSQSLLIYGVLLACGIQSPDFAKYTDQRMLIGLALFTVTVVTYICTSIVPFCTLGKMSTTKTTILLQAATPMTIVGAVFILDEHYSFSQWCGVGMTLVGATYLSLCGPKHADPKKVPSPLSAARIE